MIADFLGVGSAPPIIYYNNRLIKNLDCVETEGCEIAWKHSALMGEKGTYLYLFTGGRPLEEFSRDTESYLRAKKLVSSHQSAAIIAKVDPGQLGVLQTIPDFVLLSWLDARADALENIFLTIPKPEHYDVLYKAHVLTSRIKDIGVLYRGKNKKIKYDIFGSATGRLTTEKNSFPILNLKKQDRTKITPKNDLFLELDINGAEIRTLLALSGYDQPEGDIHEWNLINCARNLSTRDEMKERFFAWLYNPIAKDYMLEKHYNKNIYNKYYNGKWVETPYGRKLETEERKALNYLLQSTTSDIVIENSYKLVQFLENRRSNISFTIHDSVILDFAKEDRHLIKEIKEIFDSTRLGRFRSNIRVGKTFGSMKAIEI